MLSLLIGLAVIALVGLAAWFSLGAACEDMNRAIRTPSRPLGDDVH